MSEFNWPKYPDTSQFKQVLFTKSIPELEEIRERFRLAVRDDDPLRDVTYSHVISGDNCLFLGKVEEALHYAKMARDKLAAKMTGGER